MPNEGLMKMLGITGKNRQPVTSMSGMRFGQNPWERASTDQTLVNPLQQPPGGGGTNVPPPSEHNTWFARRLAQMGQPRQPQQQPAQFGNLGQMGSGRFPPNVNYSTQLANRFGRGTKF